MIDIDTPAAQAKLATLPEEMRDELDRLIFDERHVGKVRDGVHRRISEGTAVPGMAILAEHVCSVAEAALNAAIVAAFEPLTVHDHSGDVARILGGDV